MYKLQLGACSKSNSPMIMTQKWVTGVVENPRVHDRIYWNDKIAPSKFNMYQANCNSMFQNLAHLGTLCNSKPFVTVWVEMVGKRSVWSRIREIIHAKSEIVSQSTIRLHKLFTPSIYPLIKQRNKKLSPQVHACKQAKTVAVKFRYGKQWPLNIQTWRTPQIVRFRHYTVPRLQSAQQKYSNHGLPQCRTCILILTEWPHELKIRGRAQCRGATTHSRLSVSVGRLLGTWLDNCGTHYTLAVASNVCTCRISTVQLNIHTNIQRKRESAASNNHCSKSVALCH